MNPTRLVPYLFILLVLSSVADAQRIWPVLSEPSDEEHGIENEVMRGWLCYDANTGKLQNDCAVSFRMSPSIGGPGVQDSCVPDASGKIEPLTCGNGGHTHLENDRPVIFPGTEVRYFGDTNPAALDVDGESPVSIFLGGFQWTVSQAGGYYTFDTSMTAPPGRYFVSFVAGVLYLNSTLEAIGSVNVTHARDTLHQLPDDPSLYAKERRGPNGQIGTDIGHVDAVAYSATDTTIEALKLIAAEFLTLTTDEKISYNDISLPKGGVMDYKAYDLQLGNPNRWQQPHKTHREGVDTDVNHPSAGDCTQSLLVEHVVDKILVRNRAAHRSALYCEPGGNYHIDTTALKVPGGTTVK